MESNELSTISIATTAVTKELYQDVFQPAARKSGEILKLGVDTIDLLLAPLSGLVWSYETILDTIKPLIAERIKNIAEDKLRTPEPSIAIPTMEALRYTLGQNELRNLFINLLVTSMNSDTVDQAHPAFVEMIKQMSPLDAKLIHEITSDKSGIPSLEIRLHYKKDDGALIPYLFEFDCTTMPLHTAQIHLTASVDNLSRLGLITVKNDLSFIDESMYPILGKQWLITYLKSTHKAENETLQGVVFCVTVLGRMFANACFPSSVPITSDPLTQQQRSQ